MTPKQIADVIAASFRAALMQVEDYGAVDIARVCRAAANNAAQALEIDPVPQLVDIATRLGCDSLTVGLSQVSIHMPDDDAVVVLAAQLDLPQPAPMTSLDGKRVYLQTGREIHGRYVSIMGRPMPAQEVPITEDEVTP